MTDDAPAEKPNLLTAHAAVANIVRQLVKTDEALFAQMVTEGVAPPPDWFDLMKLMRAALKHYDDALEASKKLQPKAMIEYARTALATGDTEGAALALATLSMATDYAEVRMPER